MPSLYALIPVFNRVEHTLKCLETLAAASYPDVTVIVIDDGSSDGTSERVAENFPNVEILQGTGDLWWSGSVNLGLRHVLEKAEDDDLVLLLNNDVILPEGYLGSCKAAARRHSNALIGSVVVKEADRDTILGGGMMINWWTAKFHNLNAGKRLSDFKEDHVERVSVLTGRGVVFPIKAFRSVGLYDEVRLPQCGDTEIPRQAALSGFELFVDYSMVVYNPPEDTNHINHRPFFRLSDLGPYLFDVHSNTRMIYRFHFAMKSNRGLLRCIVFLFFDLARVGVHFFRHLRLL